MDRLVIELGEDDEIMITAESDGEEMQTMSASSPAEAGDMVTELLSDDETPEDPPAEQDDEEEMWNEEAETRASARRMSDSYS